MATLTALELTSLIISGVGAGASVVSQEVGARAQINQFRQQQTQLRLQQVESESRRADQLQRIFGQQAAQEVARGISLASPSFKAIQQQSFNAFNDDTRAEALTLSFKENVLNSRIDSTRSAAYLGEFMTVANFGASAFNTMNLNNNISNQQVFDARDELARQRRKGSFQTKIPGLSPEDF